MPRRRQRSGARSGRDGLFRSLRHSVNLRIYLAGHCVSVTGTWVQRVAQDWLILEITHNGAALGLSVAAQFAPMLLLAPYGGLLVDRLHRRRTTLAAPDHRRRLAALAPSGGLLVDRLDRRRTILATQAISGLLAVVLALITLLDVVSFWSVLAL